MNLFDNMIQELREYPHKIIIYGAGVAGKKVMEFLHENDIRTDGFAVDAAYYRENSSFLGLPVYALEQLLASEPCAYVIGFMGLTPERDAALRSQENADRVYALDFAGRYPIGVDNRMTDSFMQMNGALLSDLREKLADSESQLEFDAYIHQQCCGEYFKRYAEKQPQYFDSDVISFGEDEVMADCGAYDGDTALAFLKTVQAQTAAGKPASVRKIFAFEADSANADKMRENLRDIPQAVIVPKGVYDHSGVLHFSADNTTNSMVAENGIEIPVTTIDETVGDENVTFIKMDIEGSELKALHGAEKTILRCRPKLAVCVYHRPEDLVTIPQYILSLHPDYRLYFRNYRTEGVESVIYAI